MEKLLQDLINLFGQLMPELRTVDEDYGQLEMLNQENRDTYPLTFPAVLIDAPECSWTNIKGLSQIGQATIRARLILDCYDDTHYGSTTTEKIAERAAMRSQVHQLLQGHRIDGFGPLIRSGSRFFTWDHAIKVYEQTYSCEVTEIIEPPTTGVQASPEVSARI
jgi:hypothetical protein